MQNDTPSETSQVEEPIADIKENTTSVVVNESDSESNKLTKKLQDAWQNIAESLTDEGPRINAAIQIAQPEFVNPDTVLVHVSVESQEELYQKYDQKVLQVLRKEFANNKLQFEFKKVATELDKNRPLTVAEQYKELITKNSVLDVLRQKFDLDIKN